MAAESSVFPGAGKEIAVPVIVIAFLLLLVPPAFAADESSRAGASVNTSASHDVLFFYGDGCVHCENVRPFIDELATRYPDMNFQYLEVYHNTTNLERFQQIAASHNIASPGVPTLVVGDTILIGETRIQNGAELEISLCSSDVHANTTPNGTANCTAPGPDLTLPLVIGGALADSVNPCAFAVLIFLLLSIITLQSRRRVLMVGGIYIAAVFVFYLLSGIGLFALVQGSGFSSVLYTGAAALAIILGLVNIIDVIRKNEGFILAIPESKKGVIERYVNTASLPAAFILGILVGIFELPCTGGIYLAILSMMSRTMTFQDGLPYLVLYNLIFILPLIVILLIVTFGLSPERVNSWRLENRRMLRLIIGIVMIAIGVVMLSVKF